MDNQQVTTKTRLLAEFDTLQKKYTPDEQQLLGSMLLMVETEEAEVEGHVLQTGRVYDVAQQHRQDLLREAEDYRLVSEASKGKLSTWARFNRAVGGFLIRTGLRMMGRRAPARPAHAAGD